MYTEEQKQQIYKRWQERGKPWFNIDPTKDATWEERQIVLEMKKRENSRRTSPKPVNEIKTFDRLVRDVANY